MIRATSKAWPVLALAGLLSLPLVGCVEEQGPAEKAGEKIDEAMEDVGDAIEDASDELDEKIDDVTEEIDENIDGNA